MKLSEMSTKQAAVCMVEIAAPMGAIAKNATMMEWLQKVNAEKREQRSALQMITELIPVLLRDNYDDVIHIVAVLCDKTKEEVDKQPVKQTIADVKASLDGELLDFFQ